MSPRVRLGRRKVATKFGSNGQPLACLAYLAWKLDVPEITIRRHCKPVDWDGNIGLYDVEQVAEKVAGLKLRPGGRRTPRREVA